jgi:hypothetical protein
LTRLSWSPSSGDLIHPSYFDRGDIHLEDRGEFIEDFWVRKYILQSCRMTESLWIGHYQAYLTRLREAHPNAIAFVNPPIFKEPPNLPEELKRGRVALSSHYYDGITMLGKRKPALLRTWRLHQLTCRTSSVQCGTYSTFVTARAPDRLRQN